MPPNQMENIMNMENAERILAELVAAVEERLQTAARQGRMQDVLDAAHRLLKNGSEMGASRS